MGLERSPLAQGWLDGFPKERRSTVANRFLFTVRAGIKDPHAVLAATERRTNRQFDGDILDRIQWDRMGALSFAQWAVDYEAVPYEDRSKFKEERAEKYRSEYMAEQAPTEKQIAYLKALGYTGAAPESKKAASDLIEERKRIPR